MTTVGEAIELALFTLVQDLPGLSVRIEGDQRLIEQDATEMIVVRFIAGSPAHEYERGSAEVLLQVDAYAETVGEAVTLSELAQGSLENAGFAWTQSRPAPRGASDTLNGWSTDYEGVN